MEQKIDLVKIEWVDATTRHDISMTVEDAIKEELVNAETIGYLLYQDKEKTIISPFVFINNEELEMYPKTINVIPTKCIKNQFPLKFA